MSNMLTCTWAPTVFAGNQVVDKRSGPATLPAGDDLLDLTTGLVQRYEAMGLSHLLIAQRWYGSGDEIEASSLDCLAMTALFAGCTDRLQLITAIHPGFFQPAAIAKWGATLDLLSRGRWAINLTSGWNLQEFDMYGIDPLSHDERYARSSEFLEVLRGAWDRERFSFDGRYYQIKDLELEPRPTHPLTIYQGGQSEAAMTMAANHSDWMFLNGGSPEKIASLIDRARAACGATGRELRFAVYAAPLCRETDGAAWEEIDARLARIDQGLLARRRERTGGAEGMWSDDADELSALDSNEGYAARLIGSPDTVIERIEALHAAGVDMLHLDLRDKLFCEAVLPAVQAL